MPNWCVNKLTIIGPKDSRDRLVAQVKGEDTEFDFGKVVPVPETPTYTATSSNTAFTCGCTSEYIDNAWRVNGKEVVKRATDNGTIGATFSGTADYCPEHDAIGVQYSPNNWYNWNTSNWGTKWNAAEAYVDHFDAMTIISFETAWAPAEPVVAALAEQFADCQITHDYVECGMEFAGRKVFNVLDEDDVILLTKLSGAVRKETVTQTTTGFDGAERSYDRTVWYNEQGDETHPSLWDYDDRGSSLGLLQQQVDVQGGLEFHAVAMMLFPDSGWGG